MPEFNEFVKWLTADFNRVLALIAVVGGVLTAIFAPLIRFPLQLRAVRNQEKLDGFTATIKGMESLSEQKDARIAYLEGLQREHDNDRTHWANTRAQLSLRIEDLESRLRPWPDMPTESAIIIIVEDNTSAARTICRVVERMGLEAFVTTKGYDALRHIRSGQFKLMVLDFGLPDINGIDVAIAARREGIEIPIIGITGVATDIINTMASNPRLIEARFAVILPKTSRAAAIQLAIKTALESASGGAEQGGKG